MVFLELHSSLIRDLPSPPQPLEIALKAASTVSGRVDSLGIIAGGGELPARVADAARATGRGVFIVALEGFADAATLAPYPHRVVRLGAAGRILATLRERHCRDVVLIGTVRRPSVLDMRPDMEGARLLRRVGRAIFAGDDRLLSTVIQILGEEGFRVIGAHEVLAGILAPAGLLTRATADDGALADIARGIAVARAIGEVDVGQGCVVQQGVVLAVEAIEGTDAMLARCASLARAGAGGVLVKLVKPGQERRADLPTIGIDTVRAARLAGLRGIAFEAQGVMLADREATVAAADEAGLFLLGLDPTGLGTKGDTA